MDAKKILGLSLAILAAMVANRYLRVDRLLLPATTTASNQ